MSALEEGIERYKAIATMKRLALVAGVSLLGGAYLYWENVSGVEADLETAVTEQTSTKEEQEKMVERVKTLPELQERLRFVEEQFKKAAAKLPDTLDWDYLLEEITQFADKHEVKLTLFDPLPEVLIKGQYPYKECPLRVEVQGKFEAVARFFDSATHIDRMVKISKLEIERAKDGADSRAIGDRSRELAEARGGRPEQQVDPEVEVQQRARLARRNSTTKVVADLLLFRSLQPSEAQALEAETVKATAVSAPGVPVAPPPTPGMPQQPPAPDGAGNPNDGR